jgi:hypothetical protein
MSFDSFIHTSSNIIVINGITVSLEALKTYDPSYTLPTGIKSVRYTHDSKTGTGYHYQHDGIRNLRANHPCPELDKYILNLQSIKEISDNLAQESKEIDELIAKVTTPYTEKRKQEYPVLDELVVALWELVVESNPNAMQKIQEIQSRRIHIKQKYPANFKK